MDREGDGADTETSDDLDGGKVTGRRTGAAVADHESKGEDLDAETEKDDRLEVANVPDSDTHGGGGQGAREAGERGDPLSGQGGLVRRDEDVGVAVHTRWSASEFSRRGEERARTYKYEPITPPAAGWTMAMTKHAMTVRFLRRLNGIRG